MIQSIKKHSKEIKNFAFKYMQYNPFALLPENVLYSMFKSGELEVRNVAHKNIVL